MTFLYDQKVEQVRGLEAEVERLRAENADLRQILHEAATDRAEIKRLRAKVERLRATKISELDRDMRRENEDQRQEIERLRATNAELVAALEQLVARYQDTPDPTDTNGQAVFEQARAAIAKAGGKE